MSYDELISGLPDGTYRLARGTQMHSFSWIITVQEGEVAQYTAGHAGCYSAVPREWRDWTVEDAIQLDVDAGGDVAHFQAGVGSGSSRYDNYYR